MYACANALTYAPERVHQGEVTYDITNFVEKNKDELSIDIEELTTVKTNFEQLMALAKRDAEKKADLEAAKVCPTRKCSRCP